jgi:hypothetical protein
MNRLQFQHRAGITGHRIVQPGLVQPGIAQPGIVQPGIVHGIAQRSIVVSAALVLLGLGMVLPGCARVRPYEREFLSDPIMSIEASMDAEVRELKWLEAREGSTGGTGGAGGGCACN